MRWLILAAAALVPAVAPAQQSDAATSSQTYESRRAAALQQLEAVQRQLNDVRAERVRLEARLDSATAAATRRRAEQLLMSDEQDALNQLDGIISVERANMLAQRDRMLALGAAVRARTHSVLVVLVRADSTPPTMLGAAELHVDSATVTTHGYTATENSALRMGAVDELYRSDVLPTPHMVRLRVVIDGRPVVQTTTVTAHGDSAVYVQFAVRDGQLVATSWTSRGTSP